MTEIGFWLTKWVTIPLCIIGLVLCWAGRKGEKNLSEQIQARVPGTNEILHCRLARSRYSLSAIDEKAKSRQMNRTEFVLQAVEMAMAYDEFFTEKVEVLAEKFNLPTWMIVQNIVIGRLAEIHDKDATKLKEFIFTTDGFLTGEDLFEELLEVPANG